MEKVAETVLDYERRLARALELCPPGLRFSYAASLDKRAVTTEEGKIISHENRLYYQDKLIFTALCDIQIPLEVQELINEKKIKEAAMAITMLMRPEGER